MTFAQLKIKNLFSKLNARELDNKKIILVMLVALAVIYLDFRLLIKSQLRGIKSAGSTIAKLNKDMDTLDKDLKMMQQSQSKPEAPSVLKAKKIISEEAMPHLLSEISSLANQNKVKIMQIKSAKELKAKDTTYEGQKAIGVLISLNLLSDYHYLGVFINALERNEVFIAVDKIKITSSSGDYSQQRVDLGLVTYVRK